MPRKKKNSDMFEGTFLEGLMSLDEVEVSKNLREVAKNDKILGVLSPLEIKISVLSSSRLIDYAKLLDDVFLLRPKTSDEAEKYLFKMVSVLQQYAVLRNLFWTLIKNRLDLDKMGFFSLFKNGQIGWQIEIKKGFKIVYCCQEEKEIEIHRKILKYFSNFNLFESKAWEDFYFKDGDNKEKEVWKERIKYLNEEIKMIFPT